MQISLSKPEQKIVEYIAKLRNSNKKMSNVEDKKFSDRTPLQINVEGFGAELAFCKHFNIYPDFSIHNRAGEHDYDYGGARIDVKFSPTPFLIVPPHKKKGSADVYTLIGGQYPHYEMIGWCYEDQLMNDACFGDHFGCGNCYAIHRDKLYNFMEHIW